MSRSSVLLYPYFSKYRVYCVYSMNKTGVEVRQVQGEVFSTFSSLRFRVKTDYNYGHRGFDIYWMGKTGSRQKLFVTKINAAS